MRSTLFRLFGAVIIASGLAGANVYAKCTGASEEGYSKIQRCANYNGCGSYTMLKPLEISDSCPTWCCPGSATVIYSSDCTFHGATTILGEPYCCESGSEFGQAVAFRVACPAIAVND